jgi:hypothetical protein
MAGQLAGAAQIWIQMADELMPVEIEVYPMRGAAALAAAEYIAVETARLVDVAHLHGDMERCQWLIDDDFTTC